MKITLTLLLLLSISVASAAEGNACLLKHFDEFTDNRVTLFEKVHVAYEKKHPNVYKVYGPVLTTHTLFAKINQYVFHYFVENDITQLKLRYGLINAVPNWIKDACAGPDCINMLYVKLMDFPEFEALYTQWDKVRKQTKESYKQKEIAKAGKIYFDLLGEKDVLPYAIKDMRYYSFKVDRLVCE